MTFNIEQRVKQFSHIADEIDTVAMESRVSGRGESRSEDNIAMRLKALACSVRDLSAAVAADMAVDIARHEGAREALAASEREFRSIAENLPDNIARWDCLGNYLYINPTHERVLCKPAAEVIGTRIPESHDHVIAAIAHVVATGEVLPFVRQTTRDETGETRVHEVSLIPERDTEGQIVSVLGICRDMTRQIQMEETLAASERQFRTLAENLPNYLARYTTSAEFVYVNPSLEALLGCKIKEAAGRTPMQLCPDGRFEEYEGVILETARTGEDGQLEFRFTTADGQQSVHQVHLVAERDATGVIVSVQGIGSDMTGLRRAEQDLWYTLNFVEGIIAAIPDILFEMDRDGRCLNVWTQNPDMFANPVEMLLGRMVGEVFSSRQAATLMQAIREADRKGVAYGHTLFIDLPDGRRRWFENSLAKKPGETPATDTFIILSRDVTVRTEAEQALDTARGRLHGVLHTIPDMVWLKDADGVYLICNGAFERLIGMREAEILGKMDYDLFDKELADFFREKDLEAIAARRICINEEWVTYSDTGERGLLETRKVPLFGADGNVVGVLGVGRDVTERKHIEEMLASREREFRTLVEHSPDLVMRYGKDLRHLYVNPTFASLIDDGEVELIGKKPSETPGMTFSIDYEQQIAEVFANGKDLVFEVMWGVGEDAQLACYQVKLVPEFGAHGAVENVLVVGRDITELHASRQKIHHMAFHDPLTGLPNRRLFNEHLHQLNTHGHAHGPSAGVMMIDLDRFKGINDTMGHSVGDELLSEAAIRLRACVRACDTVARFGGDEFVILLPDVPERRMLEDIAGTIIDRFDECFMLKGKEMFVSCSIGIALYPADSVDADDLMKYTDLAMYAAKRSGGRGFHFYSKELTVDATAHLQLESELRHAIKRNELELHYQPKVSLRDSEVIGSEALLRWHRPGVGMVPPNQFIPVAEETCLIADLGEWVLREASRSAVEWNASETRIHKVAVNLSARQFQFHDFASMVGRILDETGCQPGWLELEITESLLLKEDGTIMNTLLAFKSMGLSIAIDDFGTGYSALSYLARFPIDTLKIDRSFVQKATTDRRHAELVKAILSMAQCLGQEVVAEGVETTEQAAFLKANGCQVAQGFLYGRPRPKSEMALLPRYLA